MAISEDFTAQGECLRATCDECGDTIVENCENFREAVEGVKAHGALRPAQKPRWPHPAGGTKWHHYCAECARELGV